MSEQELDLRKSLHQVWRHRLLVGSVAAAGLIAGAAFTVLSPPLRTSTAMVVLPQTVRDTRTQAVIASSDTVLASALAHIRADPALALESLRRRIQVRSLTSDALSISAQGATPAQAERTAEAVASSYTSYARSGLAPGKPVYAKAYPATPATGTPMALRLLDTGGPGVLAGGLIGAIVALGISHNDRRLRIRDDIADCIGAPVLASVSVARPSGAAGWAGLLTGYKPGAVDAWRLRRALQHLDLTGGDGSGASIEVLSLSSDPKALALGPQLAVFAASVGIPTALVVGPQQDPAATATLRAACAASPQPGMGVRNLWVAVNDDHDAEALPGAALTVVVGVVDGQAPSVPDTMRAPTTVLGVSSGAATAEHLARVAASAATDGRHIAGILVADPDAADHTTGRLPQLSRPALTRMPTRVTGTATEIRT